MINAKKKGNHWENVWANWLKDNGIKAFKDNMSGGGNREKGDVSNDLNLHMEVKAVKGINLQKVWKKAELECQKTHNSPLIAIHFDGMKEEDFLVVIRNHDWLDLIKKPVDERIEGIYKDEQDDRNKKWAINNLISYAKKVISLYEAQ